MPATRMAASQAVAADQDQLDRYPSAFNDVNSGRRIRIVRPADAGVRRRVWWMQMPAAH